MSTDENGWGNHVCSLYIIMKMANLLKMKYSMTKEMLTVNIYIKIYND